MTGLMMFVSIVFLTFNVRIGWYVGGEVMIKVVVVYNVVDDVGC